MSLNSINKFLTNNTLWAIFSFVVMGCYLSPLFYEQFYVPVFDNLDSNVVWYKILAESGMIFAANDAIIPNMMNGLPRSSYGSEFDVILWLYYFFEPKTAFVINEIAIHIIAFFSMFIFLKSYVAKADKSYGLLPVYIGSLYFALLPFWSGAGASVALLPLVTYSLLNIKNNRANKWDWILLVFLPLYSSFIFLYIFYIIMAGMYMIYDIIQQKKLNKPLFFALFLMGTMFLLSEYRLVISMFFDNNFVSHRKEFNFFFDSTFMDSYRGIHTFFLNGHNQHLVDLQFLFVLPVIMVSMLFLLIKKEFSQKESMIIWILILLSFAIDIWSPILTQLYSLTLLAIYALLIFLLAKESRLVPILFILQIVLLIPMFMQTCECMKYIADYLPIFKALNITRVGFVQPLIWSVLLTMVTIIFIKRLKYSYIFIALFIILQLFLSFKAREFSTTKTDLYSSFEEYYAPELFTKILKDTPEIRNKHVLNFGIEPAVSLYNGIYTVDGYSANYPLSYKHKFRKVIQKFIEKNKDASFDRWASKLYIMQIRGTPNIYKVTRGSVFQKVLFDSEALCNLNTDYIISAYDINVSRREELELKTMLKGGENSWDIYLYQLKCQEISQPHC